MKPDFFDTDKTINHPDFKSSPFMIKKGLKPLKDGKDEKLSEGAHFQTSKAQTIPLRTVGRNLDDFLKNTTEIFREESWQYREQSLYYYGQITLPNDTKLL